MKIGADDVIAAGGRLEDLPRADPPAPHCTDLGNAERFVRMYGPDLRYVWPWATWLQFTGTHWARDPGYVAAELAKMIPRSLYQEAGLIEDPAQRKAMAAWAIKSEAQRQQQALVLLARSALPVAPEALDQHSHLFNVPNGTLDTCTSELRGHRHDDFLTKLCPTPYDPAARCPRFLKFLDAIFAGDTALIAWLQKVLGSLLVGEVLEHLLLILWGVGANGKSTLLNVLEAVIGEDYVKRAAMSTFLAKRGDGITNDLAALAGARAVFACESGQGRRLDVATVKAMTGGEKITARFLRAEFFSFAPTFKVILSTNHRIKGGVLRPTVRTADGTGSRQLFSWEDLCRCGLLSLLHDGGMKLDGMRAILRRVADFDWNGTPPPRNAGRDSWLIVESVPEDRIRVVHATAFAAAARRLDHVQGVNLSALQRTLHERVARGRRA
jgi:hypothetical protein